MLKPYLIAYNVGAMVGWGYIMSLCVDGLKTGKPIIEIWKTMGVPLMYVQSSAALEIVHSALGMVRSPLSSTFIQVMSRLLVIWGFTWWAPACHEHYSLLLMVMSWAAVEVPRYLFYSLNLIPAFSGDKMPSPIFALRYSLFMVLYPTGITGEILQGVAALPFLSSLNPLYARIAHVYLAMYLPFGPYMILNMWGMRKRAYKKRGGGKKKSRPVNGLVWPITNAEKGERSTSVTNKSIWESSVRGIDDELANSIQRTKSWRFGYVKYVEKNLRCCLRSRENALAVAKQGLEAAKNKFLFVRDGKTLPLSEAMSAYNGTFHTGFVKGTASKPNSKLTIPYTTYGSKKPETMLQDLEAMKQIDAWVEAGTIENSAGEGIKNCIKNKEWMDLSDRYFVLLGATSAMGPLNALLALGANIIAIDIDREGVWKSLIEKARNSCGTLTFPLSKPQNEISSDEELFKCAGSNLLTKTPEIANWICTVHSDKALTIGNYTYLDGALHVQLALACDSIMERLCSERSDTSIAFLCTPTDCHAIPKDAHDAAQKNYKNAPSWQKAVEGMVGGMNIMGAKQLVKNALKPVEESGLYLVDGIVAAQGPNYALAKRLQHWRAVVAHSNGHIVSSNIAPSTATKSVVSNASFAAAYNGFSLFKSMEVMYQETSSAVMLALLINDLRNPESVANPQNKIENPFLLFQSGSFHGGVWRCAYKCDSIGVTAAMYYYLNTYKAAVFATVAGLVGTVNYIVKGSPL